MNLLNIDLKKHKQLLNEEKIKNKKMLEDEIFISDCYKFICRNHERSNFNINEKVKLSEVSGSAVTSVHMYEDLFPLCKKYS